MNVWHRARALTHVNWLHKQWQWWLGDILLHFFIAAHITPSPACWPLKSRYRGKTPGEKCVFNCAKVKLPISLLIPLVPCDLWPSSALTESYLYVTRARLEIYVFCHGFVVVVVVLYISQMRSFFADLFSFCVDLSAHMSPSVSLTPLSSPSFPIAQCTVLCACIFLHWTLQGLGNSQWLTQPRCCHPPLPFLFLLLSFSIFQLPVLLASPLPELVKVWGNLAWLTVVFPNEGAGVFAAPGQLSKNSGSKSRIFHLLNWMESVSIMIDPFSVCMPLVLCVRLSMEIKG